MGQPFAAVGADPTGRVSLDWGVYGVPETFIVDGDGFIRFKWIGPLEPKRRVRDVLAPEIEKAKKRCTSDLALEEAAQRPSKGESST